MSEAATPQADAPAEPVSINLERARRGILLGKSRIGKSTLATELVTRFRADYPTSNVLIIDSKPRYRAEYDPMGLRIKYRHWAKGDFVPDAIGWSNETVKLDDLFLNTHIAIFQSLDQKRHPTLNFFDRASDYAEEMFRHVRPDRPGLLYLDELYDEMHGNWIDNRLLRTVRSGGELNLACLVGSQRPKAIPLPTLTEADNYYVFYLASDDDRRYLTKYGIPTNPQPLEHWFLFVRNLTGGKTDERLLRLKME